MHLFASVHNHSMRAACAHLSMTLVLGRLPVSRTWSCSSMPWKTTLTLTRPGPRLLQNCASVISRVEACSARKCSVCSACACAAESPSGDCRVRPLAPAGYPCAGPLKTADPAHLLSCAHTISVISVKVQKGPRACLQADVGPALCVAVARLRLQPGRPHHEASAQPQQI